ncbi:MAG: hypothetical protein HY769_00170 [Candidatus Stahlbacteria bacterium]|nr:hypothetical protein [Candidatus Stahlbacteria bacterium]
MISLLLLVVVGYIHEPWRWKWIEDFRVVNSISSDTRYVYFAGSKGIRRFDKLTEQWETPITHNPFPDNINFIAIDGWTNELWFTTTTILGKYNPVFEDLEIFANITSMPCSLGISKDYIYLWNKQQGSTSKCIRFNKLSRERLPLDSLPSDAERFNLEWFPKSLPSKYPWLAPYFVMDKYLNQYPMTCAYEDEQYVWIGTNGDGIYKYNKTTKNMDEHFIFGVPNKKSAILQDGEYLWMGTPQEIIRWDKKKWVANYYLQFGNKPNELNEPNEQISMVSDSVSIWLGGTNGLFRFDKQIERWDNIYQKQVSCLAVGGGSTSDGEIWVGNHKGLLKCVNNKIVDVLSDIWVNDVKVNNDEIWVATPGGVLLKRSENPACPASAVASAGLKTGASEWSKIEDSSKILPHGVYRILVDGKQIYFGTSQALVVHENREPRTNYQYFIYPVYLCGKRILALAGDSSELYVGTDAGVSVWDKKHDIWKQYIANNSPIKGSTYSIVLDKEYAYLSTDFGIIQLKR